MKRNLCYLLGAIRDGSLPKCGKKTEVTLASDVSRCWLEEVANLASEHFKLPKGRFKIYEVWDKKSKVACFRLKVYSKRVYLQLAKHYAPGEQSDWKTPNFVKNGSFQMQKAYVAAFYDAEGGCRNVENFCDGKTKTIQCWASVFCRHEEENEPLLFVKSFLEKIGMDSHIYDNDELVITGRKNIRRFYDKIPLRHPLKKRRLGELLLYFGTPSAKA